MGSWGLQKRSRESIVPADIAQVFGEDDIPKVWDTLEKVFHLNVKYWKPRFETAFNKAPHEQTRMEVFYGFGLVHFQKSINVLRGNDEHAHTFEKIVRYVVQGKIDEKIKEAGMIQKKYGVSSYYKVTNKKY